MHSKGTSSVNVKLLSIGEIRTCKHHATTSIEMLIMLINVNFDNDDKS